MEKDMTKEFDHLAIMTQVNKTQNTKSVFDQIFEGVTFWNFSFDNNICSNPFVLSNNI